MFLFSGRSEVNDLLEVYDAEDVYNLDETGLFYRLGPNSTLGSGSIYGLKQSKERISIALCCNASGTDKQKPLVIGKFARPRCFVKTFDLKIYVDYTFNKKAWMTSSVFQDWLKQFDKSMRLQGQHAILSLSKLEPRDCSVNDASEEDDHDVGDDAVLKKVTKVQARNSLNDVINYLEQQGIHFDQNTWTLPGH